MQNYIYAFFCEYIIHSLLSPGIFDMLTKGNEERRDFMSLLFFEIETNGWLVDHPT